MDREWIQFHRNPCGSGTWIVEEWDLEGRGQRMNRQFSAPNESSVGNSQKVEQLFWCVHGIYVLGKLPSRDKSRRPESISNCKRPCLLCTRNLEDFPSRLRRSMERAIQNIHIIITSGLANVRMPNPGIPRGNIFKNNWSLSSFSCVRSLPLNWAVLLRIKSALN